MDYSEEIPHNERLEFLGDAILDTIIAKQLFDDFPEYTEAKLTLYKIALVREETLALVAKEINLGEHILISKWEQRSNGREKHAILSDTLEAIIGYLFIEWWYILAQKFVLRFIYKHISEIGNLLPVKSYKARVQEHSQQLYKKLPLYTETEDKIEETGNVLQYKSILSINDKVVSEWIAISKKKAQELAAKIFWETQKK